MTPAERSGWQHVLWALEAHRIRVERNGSAVPDLAVTLESTARFCVTQGQAGSLVADAAEVSDAESMPARLLTYRSVADLLACSESTVKRLVATKELPVVRIGHASRVALADVDDYVDRLRGDGVKETA